MRLPRSLPWRFALACAGPAALSAGALVIFLIAVPSTRPQSNAGAFTLMASVAATASVALSAALAIYMGGRTSHVVRAVAHGARRLADGDFSHRVNQRSRDESDDLSTAFNTMASALAGLVSDLSGERDKLYAILDTMADGVVVVDDEGRIALMNAAAETLLDVGANEAIGRHLVDMVRDHEMNGLVSRTLDYKTVQQSEIDLLRQRRFVSALATPLSYGTGAGALVTLHDLTRMRQVDTTRREFVSNVSHELRSPLASIRAMLETLTEGALDEPDAARDFIDRINRDVHRMTVMVNDLLDLSRLESGQAQLHLQPMDLRPLIEDVAVDLLDRADGGRIRVKTDFPEDFPLVVGEEEKLRQVLSNLLENAVKASLDEGDLTVAGTITDRFVEVSIRDTGAGIPAEHLPHVFERFYKVDRARRDGGTGLGLAIVKHLVQAHGGDVRAASEEGVGSTFSFTLPRAS